MKKILLVYHESAEKKYAELLKCLMQHGLWEDYEFEKLLFRKNIYGIAEQAQLAHSDADIIISIDMEGFQYKTLLENYQYNIMPTKQMHLIVTNEKWEEYKEAEFAINLFVYIPCADRENCDADVITADMESPNLRYYASSLLEMPSRAINLILEDFVKSAHFT